MDGWKVSVVPFSVIVDESVREMKWGCILSQFRCTLGEATHVAGAP